MGLLSIIRVINNLFSSSLDCPFSSEEVEHHTHFTKPWAMCNRSILHVWLPWHNFEIFANDMVYCADRHYHYYKWGSIKRKWAFCHHWKCQVWTEEGTTVCKMPLRDCLLRLHFAARTHNSLIRWQSRLLITRNFTR